MHMYTMHKLLKPSTHALVDTRSARKAQFAPLRVSHIDNNNYITEDLSGPSYMPSILPSISRPHASFPCSCLDDQLFLCSILVMLSMFVFTRSLTESDSQMQKYKTASERVCHFTFSEPSTATVDGLGTTSCRVGNKTVRVDQRS
jgi:hypothetical protein